MRTAKDFLSQECTSLGRVLEETLRFKYGLEGSKDFFDEIEVRLKYIADELEKIPDSDSDSLQAASNLLSKLSALVSRIERSSIEEYSWPFVHELRRIATALCTEATLTNPYTPPEFHVLSRGGLDTYAIHPEENRPSGSRKRIHTIIFPRTLKHFVLLHSILGHEVGHAMWRCSVHQSALNKVVATGLFNSGVFENPVATAAWLYSPNAPDRVKVALADLAPLGIDQNNFFQKAASWQAWAEEILCDFIGLMTFGPSFVAAECSLLYSLDPSGAGIGTSHPPVGCRANYLLSAANTLNYDREEFDGDPIESTVQSFWEGLRAKKQSNTWFDLFTTEQLKKTTASLRSLFQSLPPSLYEPPNKDDLKSLVHKLADNIPPVGFEVDAERAVQCRKIDFRHILYAGWIVASSDSSLNFEQINRLCEHGIMQQLAIDLNSETM